MRHSAKGGNAEAGSRTHVRCACAAADVRGARGQHTGLGPWARRLPNSTTPRSPAAATTRAALDAIMVWKVKCGQQEGLDNLCFDDGSGDAQQRFLTEDGVPSGTAQTSPVKRKVFR